MSQMLHINFLQPRHLRCATVSLLTLPHKLGSISRPLTLSSLPWNPRHLLPCGPSQKLSCLFSSSFPWTQYVLHLLVTRCPTLSSIFLFHVTVLSAWLWRGPRNRMSLPATEPNTAVGSGHTPSWAGGSSVSTREHLTNNKGCLQEGSNSPGPCRTQAIFHPGNFGRNCGSGSEQVFKGGNGLL